MVDLKSWHNGLLNELILTIPVDMVWEEAIVQAEALLQESRTSLIGRGGQLTIDLQNREVAISELEAIVHTIRDKFHLSTAAVVTTDSSTQESAKKLLLLTYLMPPGATVETPESVSGNNALYLNATLRSGQKVVHNSHVIVAGDVNAGAEVMAAGDVIIIGALRGLAHAGCLGDDSARIIAGSMQPQQLRIGNEIALPPEDSDLTKSTHSIRRPEVARLEDGIIQVSPL